jgi:DNA-binding transcriptional regulator LsrR (DeoR family)
MADGDRIMLFTVLYDRDYDKLLLHIGHANSFLQINEEGTLGDIIGHFFKGRTQEIVGEAPAEILTIPLAALKTQTLGLITVAAGAP